MNSYINLKLNHVLHNKSNKHAAFLYYDSAFVASTGSRRAIFGESLQDILNIDKKDFQHIRTNT